ncbi:MAG TPA: oxygenase MpaB family protein [Thermomonospora sp.]|nr:oxygenase MpaB family protein [Thermomonospora sp.]
MAAADVTQVAERVPTEFRHYWRAAERPGVRTARAVARRVFGMDLLPDEDRVLRFAQGYYDADPLADAFVAEVYMTGGARRARAMLDQALAHGVEAVPDAPEPLVRLFAQIDEEPAWLDRERSALGATVFRRLGVPGLCFAGAGQLVGFTENAGVKPLAMHGGYVGASALYRLMETARFWIDTTEPGGLEPGAPGRAIAVRVRIMHAVIRHRLNRHPEWDHDAWGVPISQSESIGPLVGSAVPLAYGAKVAGLRSTRAEAEALLHFWRHVGHLMGVTPRWFPADLRECLQYLAMFRLSRAFTGGDDTTEIIESYPRAFVPRPGTPLPRRLRDEVNYRAQLGYTRLAIGSLYRRYDMPSPWPWALHPFLQWPVNFAATTLARHDPRAARLLDRYQRWRRQTWWRNGMGDTTPAYTAAETLRR